MPSGGHPAGCGRDLLRADLQRLVGRLLANELNASTVRNAIMPLQALRRRLMALDDVGMKPTERLELPAVRGKRDRIVAPDEAARLLEELPKLQRPLWATALYAGLRHGELRALRLEHVDLATGVISVEANRDHREGPVASAAQITRRSAARPSPSRPT